MNPPVHDNPPPPSNSQPLTWAQIAALNSKHTSTPSNSTSTTTTTTTPTTTTTSTTSTSQKTKAPPPQSKDSRKSETPSSGNPKQKKNTNNTNANNNNKNNNQGTTYPKGIVNRGATCFMNSILQSLLVCPPFEALLKKHQKKKNLEQLLPNLETIIRLNKDVKLGNESAKHRVPVPAEYLDTILQKFDSSLYSNGQKVRSQQHDAQEFLIFLFNLLHDELSTDTKKNEPTVTSQEDDWVEVGKNNKASSVVEYQMEESMINKIFSSKLRSEVKQRQNTTSANVQPYYVLPLEIIEPQNTRDYPTLETAIDNFLSPETLNLSVTSKTENLASKRLLFEKLPPILIFQLKRFQYSPEGLRKLNTYMSYPFELEIKRKYLSHKAPSDTSRFYRLFAVVSHEGRFMSAGHYFCDIFVKDGWFIVDDTEVARVSGDTVLNRLPYLLFYENVDSS